MKFMLKIFDMSFIEIIVFTNKSNNFVSIVFSCNMLFQAFNYILCFSNIYEWLFSIIVIAEQKINSR